MTPAPLTRSLIIDSGRASHVESLDLRGNIAAQVTGNPDLEKNLLRRMDAGKVGEGLFATLWFFQWGREQFPVNEGGSRAFSLLLGIENLIVRGPVVIAVQDVNDRFVDMPPAISNDLARNLTVAGLRRAG